jgi:NAD(P)-dependent dehydrogenase (short-subunit alcohol dehydrogenase family)
VDILVNNAGVPGDGPPKPVHETDPEEWWHVLAVNLTGPFLLCRAVLPDMLSRGRGVIVNVASAAALVGFPGRGPYSASKAGLVQLTRTIACEYASRGIRANALCPGWVATPMTAWRLEREETRAAVEASIPMGRVASAEEIAEAALFLASRSSRYMTGAVLVVDGGWVSR